MALTWSRMLSPRSSESAIDASISLQLMVTRRMSGKPLEKEIYRARKFSLQRSCTHRTYIHFRHTPILTQALEVRPGMIRPMLKKHLIIVYPSSGWNTVSMAYTLQSQTLPMIDSSGLVFNALYSPFDSASLIQLTEKLQFLMRTLPAQDTEPFATQTERFRLPLMPKLEH